MKEKNMRPISIVISSLRPDRLEETIDSTAMHSDLVEVVVVSPYPPKPRDFVRHVPVPLPGDPGELTFAQKFNLGARHANGEYIVYNNDDLHFRSGWAPALIKHMQANESARPYLAAFHMAVKGKLTQCYTAFGLLYANLGCIRKDDLKLIDGKLFDDRFHMYTTDIDISLRVWERGGRVSICKDVVIDMDRGDDNANVAQGSVFFDEDALKKIEKPKTYKDVWFNHDVNTFFKRWYPVYFWLFWKHYAEIRSHFTNEDGVLSPKRHNSSLLKIMLWPILNMYLNPLLFLKRKNKMDFIRNHWVRVVNRRWGSLDYEPPYSNLFKSKGT